MGVMAKKKRGPGWILRGIGKTLLTSAAIVGAYIIWLLWGTGLYYGSQQSDLRGQLEARIDQAAAAPALEEPPPTLPGDAYAIIKIPDIELDEIVVEGTATDALKKGPGHYPKTADPWDDEGKVAIAGHRTTYGAPFWDLDKLEAGDEIVLETEQGIFDYVVTKTTIVSPTATEVTRQTKEPTLILTTCNPRFSAAQRLIIFADRIDPA